MNSEKITINEFIFSYNIEMDFTKRTDAFTVYVPTMNLKYSAAAGGKYEANVQCA